jgi:hypothetical protein
VLGVKIRMFVVDCGCIIAGLADRFDELLARNGLRVFDGRLFGGKVDRRIGDVSRNRSPTWCDMAACGNRAKAAAYYRRSRAGAA